MKNFYLMAALAAHFHDTIENTSEQALKPMNKWSKHVSGSLRYMIHGEETQIV
jgi:hypothetical protein